MAEVTNLNERIATDICGWEWNPYGRTIGGGHWNPPNKAFPQNKLPNFSDPATMWMIVEGLPKTSRTYFEWEHNEGKWSCLIIPDYVLGPSYQSCYGLADTPHAALLAAVEEYLTHE